MKDGVTIDCCGILSSVGDGIYIGDNVGISEQTLIQVRGRVEIHQDVIIGPGVKIISENHNFKEQKKILKWKPKISIDTLIDEMIEHEENLL